MDTADSDEREVNKAAVRRLAEEVFTAGDVDVADDIFGIDFVDHDLRGTDDPLTTLKKHVRSEHGAFDDYRLEVLDMVAEGDRVAARFRWSGRHVRPRGDLQPTGLVMQGDVYNFYRFRYGRIIERWGMVGFSGQALG
jgi:predicted ester cyclase